MINRNKMEIARDLKLVSSTADILKEFVVVSDDSSSTYKETCTEIDRLIRILNRMKETAYKEYITAKTEGR